MIDNSYGATPPPCPWWCTELHEDQGWVLAGGVLSKTCRRHAFGADDIDGRPTELELARFASVLHGCVIFDPPTVRLMACSALSIESAQAIAATMGRLAEMTGEPRSAAA